MKLLCTCVTVGLFGVISLSREATCVTFPDLLFFHLLLQNELSQTRLNLHTNAHIHILYIRFIDKYQSLTRTLRTQNIYVWLSGLWLMEDMLQMHEPVWVYVGMVISLTLLRCSSWSCFLFKASSSSSSLDRLLPSDPAGTIHKPIKWHKTQMYTPIKRHKHILLEKTHASRDLAWYNQMKCFIHSSVFEKTRKIWLLHLAVEQWRVLTHRNRVIGGQKNTNVRQSWRDRQTEGLIGIFGYIDMMGCLHFIIHVKILLDVKYTEQHNVRQTRQKSVWSQSQWSLSRSFVPLQLVHPWCAASERKMVRLMLPQAENNMAATESTERFCFVQAKLKDKYCNAWIIAWARSEAGMQLSFWGR